jgi:uncharacterized membrane protein
MIAPRIAPMIVLALTLHVLSATIWVGGMFAANFCLRPSLDVLEAPQRLKLLRGFFGRFLPLVAISAILLVVTGYWMLLVYFGGFAGAPPYVNLMQALGWVMILLFAGLFHGPWLKFKRAVDAGDWPAAGANLPLIRRMVAINLAVGLIVVIVGGTGRYWSY